MEKNNPNNGLNIAGVPHLLGPQTAALVCVNRYRSFSHKQAPQLSAH